MLIRDFFNSIKIRDTFYSNSLILLEITNNATISGSSSEYNIK